MVELRQLVLEIGNQSCTEKPRLNAAQLKDAFKVALSGVRHTKRIAANSLEEVWQPDSWTSLKTALQASPRFSASVALHKQCEQVISLSRPIETNGVATKKKRKADSEPEAKAKTKSKKAKTKS